MTLRPVGSHRVERSLTEAEWLARVGEAFGELCSEYRQGASAGLDAAIDHYIRVLNQWRRERES